MELSLPFIFVLYQALVVECSYWHTNYKVHKITSGFFKNINFSERRQWHNDLFIGCGRTLN